MIEFGEKVKRFREEKGMTQQTMAEQLYVTRQAVSRWECGARYPDLLTTKKISKILGVTIDELVSGEELQKNMEKEPVLAQPISNAIQSMLFTFAFVSYLLMCIVSLYIFAPLIRYGAHSDRMTVINITTVIGYFVNLFILIFGLVLSIRNRLSPRRTGIIMSLPYAIKVVTLLFTLIVVSATNHKINPLNGWLIMIPFLSGACILFFFWSEAKRLPLFVIWLIAGFTILELMMEWITTLQAITELEFIVRVILGLGRVGLVLLLLYQSHVFNQKRKIAYKQSISKKEIIR